MTFTLVMVLITLVLMIVVMFFFLKKEVNDINKKSKVYFLHKAQEYTDSIKHDENNDDNSKIKNNKKIGDNENNKPSVIYVDKKANYEIKDLFKMLRVIDSKFSYDNVRLIKYFIEYYVTEDEEKNNRYNCLQKMKNYIDNVGIYNIIVNDDSKFLDKILKDLRLFNEDIFMEFYSGKDIFDIEEFCNFLDYEIGKCDPTIYVFVGNKKQNYDKINDNIKTIYSDDIYRGIKIVYLNKLYDYSLS